jgi:hypothetical protein
MESAVKDKNASLNPDGLARNWRLWRGPFRVEVFLSKVGSEIFSRKTYMCMFKGMSTTTASRDLREATEAELLEKTGNWRVTKYKAKLITRRKQGAA